MSAYLFQIAWEKSFDYLLIIYKWQFLSRFSILRDKWRVRLLQHYWMKIWHVNSCVKIHSLSPKHVWKLSERFLCCLWKAVFIHIWIQEPDQKAEENFPVVMMRPSLKLFFEGLKKKDFVPCSSLSSRRNSSTNTSCSNQNAEKRS